MNEISESIDNTNHREMVGSILGLTANRHVIMIRNCPCARCKDDSSTIRPEVSI